MPIRINLLAEAQAAEELRRKDPVKRGLKIALVLLVLMLAWSSSLYVNLIHSRGSLDHLEGRVSANTNQYVQVLSNEKQLVDNNQKLAALFALSTNRFLNADLLNALQRISAEGVQILRIRVDQNFTAIPDERPTKGPDGKKTSGHPGNNTEKITLVIEARDASANPGGEGVSHFKDAIVHNPYFQAQHISANEILLKNLSVPQTDLESGKPFVMFTFECHFQDRVLTQIQ